MTRYSYFGEPGDAPVYESIPQASTPVGAQCASCRRPIESGDRGFVIPYVTLNYPSVTEIAEHRDCFLRGLGVRP